MKIDFGDYPVGSQIHVDLDTVPHYIFKIVNVDGEKMINIWSRNSDGVWSCDDGPQEYTQYHTALDYHWWTVRHVDMPTMLSINEEQFNEI